MLHGWTFEGLMLCIRSHGDPLRCMSPNASKVDEKGMTELTNQYKDWICTAERLDEADRHVYMHCLPADSEMEVADEVMGGPHSFVFDEAENRLHAPKGIMALVMGGI